MERMKGGRSRVVVLSMMAVLLLLLTTVTVADAGFAEGKNNRHKRDTSDGAEWSIWFNSDSPHYGEGDFETVDHIEKTRHRVCKEGLDVVAAQCRVRHTNNSFDFTTTAFVNDHLLQACSSQGLICLNGQQVSGLCADYEVRFLCKDITSDGSGEGSLFPNFDFKIYIVLALVPLLIVTLRVVWSCCCRDRLCKRQQLSSRGAGHRGSVSTNGTLSASSSQASFDSTLAHPPPAYSDLFGSQVFAISDGGYVMCSKCSHKRGSFNLRRVSSVPRTTSLGRRISSLTGLSSLSDRLNALSTAQAASPSSPNSPNSPSSPTSTTSPPDTVVNIEGGNVGVSSTDSSGGNPGDNEVFADSGTNNVRASAGVTSLNVMTSQDSTTPQQQQSSNVNNTRLSIASITSVLGAVGLPMSGFPARSPSITQCACACHRKQSGAVNLAFHWDSSDGVSSPQSVMYPGMHKPVFSFSRIGSVSSFTSFTELPDYEEALEILKKEMPEFVIGDEGDDGDKNDCVIFFEASPPSPSFPKALPSPVASPPPSNPSTLSPLPPLHIATPSLASSSCEASSAQSDGGDTSLVIHSEASPATHSASLSSDAPSTSSNPSVALSIEEPQCIDDTQTTEPQTIEENHSAEVDSRESQSTEQTPRDTHSEEHLSSENTSAEPICITTHSTDTNSDVKL